ncbi:MAG: hypothetical protein LBG13_00385, partial [Holosporales bacterium]|nr:hypothetical protein [Holosporales bacterium]
ELIAGLLICGAVPCCQASSSSRDWAYGKEQLEAQYRQREELKYLWQNVWFSAQNFWFFDVVVEKLDKKSSEVFDKVCRENLLTKMQEVKSIKDLLRFVFVLGFGPRASRTDKIIFDFGGNASSKAGGYGALNENANEDLKRKANEDGEELVGIFCEGIRPILGINIDDLDSEALKTLKTYELIAGHTCYTDQQKLMARWSALKRKVTRHFESMSQFEAENTINEFMFIAKQIFDTISFRILQGPLPEFRWSF